MTEEKPFHVKHRWTKEGPLVPAYGPDAAQPGQPIPQGGTVVVEEIKISTGPAETGEEPARAGASSEGGPYKIGDLVRIKGKGKSNFKIEAIEPDENGALLYKGTNTKGSEFSAFENDLDTVR